MFNFCVIVLLQIINKINHFSVGFVNASIIIINVYVGNGARAVTESPRYCLFRDAYFVRYCRPCVAPSIMLNPHRGTPLT